MDDFRLILKAIWILKTILKITEFSRFSLIFWMISWFNILKVIFKSNSLSVNKKNQINIKCSLLNKTLHFVKTEKFSIKLWIKLTKFYQMTIISSGHKNEIQFFRNHLPCVHGYWKWFAEINDSTPLLRYRGFHKKASLSYMCALWIDRLETFYWLRTRPASLFISSRSFP